MNYTNTTIRQLYNELAGKRDDILAQAATAAEKDNLDEHKRLMDNAAQMEPQLEAYKNILDSQKKYISDAAPVGKLGDDYEMKEMAGELKAGRAVAFAPQDVAKAIVTNSTLYSGSIVSPAKEGSTIRDGFNQQVSSLAEQVNIVSLPGFASYEESYLKTGMTASAGTPAAVAGVTPASTGVRQTSDPVWRKAKMAAYNLNITSYKDKGIDALSPVDYTAKITQYALTALRQKLVNLIVNGDGAVSGISMYGILNATNTSGESIFSTNSAVTSIDEDTLRDLVFGYGGTEEVVGQARLLLSKASLAAFGDIKLATDDKRPLYEIITNGNTGTIKIGGVSAPYTICSAIGDSKLAFGDPMGYMLPMFQNFVVSVDPSCKADQRLLTILGDATVSGNLVFDKAFEIATLSA